jgi:hypothetical protein
MPIEEQKVEDSNDSYEYKTPGYVPAQTLGSAEKRKKSRNAKESYNNAVRGTLSGE